MARSRAELPPGPRMPASLQTVGWWARPTAYLERCRRRYGRRFTVRLSAQAPFVMISDPAEIKQVFTAPPDVLHPGEGARILEPIVGPNSILLLDDDAHLAQRRLVLPAFGGERIQRLERVVSEVAAREIERWPRDRPFETHPLTQRLTMEVILRAVFGFEPGERLDRVRTALTAMNNFARSPVSLLPPAQRSFGGHGAWARFVAEREQADELVYEELAIRRAAWEASGSAEADAGDDMLAAFLLATHEEGTPMSNAEIRDEMMTLLLAGHETTATSLAWGLERLARHPAVLARLCEEVDAGEGDEYLTAVVREILRCRPTLPTAQPRAVKKPVEIGGWTYPPGVNLMAAAWLVHHDAEIYPDPYAFRPERFLGVEPGTYTWIPFGGGRRRCAGANLAILEIKVVLREILREAAVQLETAPLEHVRRRAITISPARGGTITLRSRARQAAPARVPAL